MTELCYQPLDVIRQVQNANLQHMLALCARGHAFYQQQWTDAGIDVSTIRSLDDLVRLPLTSKYDLMHAPEQFRLRCPDLPLHERALWEVLHTTGSTGNPTPIYVTSHDYQAYLFQAQRVAAITGITDRDVMANLFPLTPAAMGSFARSEANAYAAGASVVGALTGAPWGDFDLHRSLDDAVRLVERHRCTILWGVTSFVRRVIMRAAELQVDFTHVRMCGVTGEASTPAMRQDMRDRLRALGAADTIIFDRYGSTESGGLAQCHEEGDWHNPAPEILYHEVVDPDTGQPLPDGERGALALTHLSRRGTVLIRYLVGDIVSLVHTPCPHCGRTGDRIVGPVVRTKYLVKVKCMLINPTALLDTLRTVPDVDEFQVVLTKQDPDDPFSMDEMIVRVASSRPDLDVLSNALIAAAQQAVGVRPRIEFVAPNAIYDPSREAKSTRLLDLRDTASSSPPDKQTSSTP
jgi:phenylacetate-coenzyme A ligase PaaK-like adenylate-forming protein